MSTCLVSRVQVQGKTEERFRKTFIICTGPRSKRPGTCRPTWERHQCVQEAYDGDGDHVGHTTAFIAVSLGKAKQGRENIGSASLITMAGLGLYGWSLAVWSLVLG